MNGKKNCWIHICEGYTTLQPSWIFQVIAIILIIFKFHMHIHTYWGTHASLSNFNLLPFLFLCLYIISFYPFSICNLMHATCNFMYFFRKKQRIYKCTDLYINAFLLFLFFIYKRRLNSGRLYFVTAIILVLF